MAESLVVFHLLPKFSMIALFGALEPLRVANRFAPGSFAWAFTSDQGGEVEASNGLPISAPKRLAEVSAAAMVVVCASYEPEKAPRKPVMKALHRLAARQVVIAGIDTGPFFMAWAGLLDGRRATCHWESLPGFRETFPKVQVVRSLFEFDRGVLTCAGGASTIDMMLAWIGQRLGKTVATQVADQLLHFRVPGGEAASRVPAASRYDTDDARVLAAIGHMEEQIEEPVSAEALATASGLSLRHLERLFRQVTGQRLMGFYLRLRLEQAQNLLTYSVLSIREIAVATGFSSLPEFSRAFRKQYGMPPSRMRKG